jgi:hypothetical protein
MKEPAKNPQFRVGFFDPFLFSLEPWLRVEPSSLIFEEPLVKCLEPVI